MTRIPVFPDLVRATTTKSTTISKIKWLKNGLTITLGEFAFFFAFFLLSNRTTKFLINTKTLRNEERKLC